MISLTNKSKNEKMTSQKPHFNNHTEEECDPGKFTGDLFYFVSSRLSLFISGAVIILSASIGGRFGSTSSVTPTDKDPQELIQLASKESHISTGQEDPVTLENSGMGLGASLAVGILELLILGPEE